MLSWLKRLHDRVGLLLKRVWFVFKLALVLVVVLIPPLITLVIAREFGTPTTWSLLMAIAVDFALVALLLAYKAATLLVTRLARFLWRFRVVRFAVALTGVTLAVMLARWNLRSSGEYAWIALVAEAVGLAAFALALFIAYPPERFMTRRVANRELFRKDAYRPLRIALWLLAIALTDSWLYHQMTELLGRNWLPVPISWLESVRVPIAWLPPALFTLFAFLAHPPYLRRAAPRWTWKVFWRSNGVGDSRFAFREFVRFPVVEITVGRVLETVSYQTSDQRRAQSVVAGNRFVFRRMLWTGFTFVIVSSMFALSLFLKWFLPSVPSDLSSVVAYRPVVSTVVYDRNQQLLCNFSLENRTWVPLEDIPQHVQDAFIAAEDKNFWTHDGIDPQGIIRAGVSNFQNGQARQGASTLTQQVIKQVVLKDPSRNWRRKTAEIILAVRFENQMEGLYGHIGAKRKILEIYLNHVYLGKNAYGVEAAAETYFGKRVQDLTLAEAAILAGLPKAPSIDSPIGHFDRAKVRQRYVLGRMVETGAITLEERDLAVAEDIGKIERTHAFNLATAPYACEEVRKFAERTFGYDAVYKQGLVIQTTFDLNLQRKAQASVRYGLLDLERRLGFAGPEGHDKDANGRCDGPAEWVADEAIEANARVVSRGRSSINVCVRGNLFPLDGDDVSRVTRWERAKPGRALVPGDLLTVRVETKPDARGKPTRYALTARRTAAGQANPQALQAALVAIDPQSGEIRAIVGGYDYNENQYNNATQARRQTGSSIKPYVYLTALVNGETVASTVLDAPICLSTASGTWCPTNYSGPHTSRVYYGNVDLATALAKSLNSVSVRLAIEVGLDKVLGTIRALGIRSKIVRVFPMAVGTPQLTLREHTAGYAQILSNGRAMAVQGYSEAEARPGIFVKEVKAFERNEGGGTTLHTIYAAPLRPKAQAVPSGDAYAMTHLMRGVVEFGTGARAKRLRRPVAGKTGTTNSFRDVWFMGGTADLVVGTWVGRMNPQPIAREATGGSVALPIWEAFMESAFPVPAEGNAFETPPRDFPIPDDVTLIRHGETKDGHVAVLPFQRGKMPASFLDRSAVDFRHGSFN